MVKPQKGKDIRRAIHIMSTKEFLSFIEMEEERIGAAAVICSRHSLTDEIPIPYYYLQFSATSSGYSDDNFCLERAKEICSFIDALPFDVKNLFFCGDRGESAVAALAAAFSRYYGQNELIIWKNYYYQPDKLIYTLQCRALGLPTFSLRTAILEHIAKRAFKKDVKKALKKIFD